MVNLIPSDKLPEVVLYTLAIAAGVLKWFSDRSVKKAEEQEEGLPEADDAEVITREDFNKLLEEVSKANEVMKTVNETSLTARNAFEDTLACITIIQILLQVLSLDRRVDKSLMRAAEEQVFAFLRHADFPSRAMVVTIFEMSIKEIRAGKYEKEKANSNVDT